MIIGTYHYSPEIQREMARRRRREIRRTALIVGALIVGSGVVWAGVFAAVGWVVR